VRGAARPPRGLSFIGDDRYCHGDEQPSCYERAVFERAVMAVADKRGPLSIADLLIVREAVASTTLDVGEDGTWALDRETP